MVVKVAQVQPLAANVWIIIIFGIMLAIQLVQEQLMKILAVGLVSVKNFGQLSSYFLTLACPPNCATCSSTGCSACSDDYFLSGNQCTQSCPDGMYGNTENGQCTGKDDS